MFCSLESSVPEMWNLQQMAACVCCACLILTKPPVQTVASRMCWSEPTFSLIVNMSPGLSILWCRTSGIQMESGKWIQAEHLHSQVPFILWSRKWLPSRPLPKQEKHPHVITKSDHSGQQSPFRWHIVHTNSHCALKAVSHSTWADSSLSSLSPDFPPSSIPHPHFK